jgi:hypothetical protein
MPLPNGVDSIRCKERLSSRKSYEDIHHHEVFSGPHGIMAITGTAGKGRHSC